MKNHAILALGLCTVAMFTACKSQESAYRQAYEKARAQEQNKSTQTVTIAPQPQEQVTPVATQPVSNDDATPVRTIQGKTCPNPEDNQCWHTHVYVIQPVHSWNTNQAKEEVDNSVVPIEEVTEHNPDSDCTCNVRHEEDCFEEAFTFNLLENNPCNDD